MLELDAELLAARAGAPRPSARARRPCVAPPAFSMKFACRGEICAPPIRWPFRPHASSIRPAPSSCSGFLKTLPNVRLFVGCAALRCACSSATVALISSGGRGASRNSAPRDDLAVAERRVPVREAELGRREPAARRRRRRRARARGSPRQSLAVGAGVHPDAAADRARDRAGELEPAEPGGARAVEADGVRRAAARDEQLALDVAPPRARRRASARAPSTPSSATSRFEPSPTAATGRPRSPRPARAPPRARRASPAARTQRAGPPVPSVVKRESATSSSIFTRAPRGAAAPRASTSPAPIVSTRSPGRARPREEARAVLERRRPADAHPRPRARRARRRRACRVTPGDRLLARRVDRR